MRCRYEEIGDDLGFNHTDSEVLRKHSCGDVKKENKNMGQVFRRKWSMDNARKKNETAEKNSGDRGGVRSESLETHGRVGKKCQQKSRGSLCPRSQRWDTNQEGNK